MQPFASSKTFFYVDTVPVPWFVIFKLQSSVANPGVKILGLEIFELFDATRCKIHANLYFMAIDFHPLFSRYMSNVTPFPKNLRPESWVASFMA